MVDFEEICWRWAYRDILPQSFLDCLFAPAPTELSVLYVHSEHQRQGIGTALLDACLGDESAYVWVIKNNLLGEAFYHSHGFEQDGVERLFDDATPGCHEVRMVRARPE